MAWRRTGDKPLSEPIMAWFGDAYMRLSFNAKCAEIYWNYITISLIDLHYCFSNHQLFLPIGTTKWWKFENDVLKLIRLNEKCDILIMISFEFAPGDAIKGFSAMVQVMARCHRATSHYLIWNNASKYVTKSKITQTSTHLCCKKCV